MPRPTQPDAVPAEGAGAGAPGTLRRRGHQLVYKPPSGAAPPENAVSRNTAPDKGDPPADTGLEPGEVAVRAVWARPLSARGGEVALMSIDRKTEVAWIPDLDALDPSSRALLGEELRAGFLAPRIVRVDQTTTGYGYRYWRVVTDFGAADFLSRSPETHVLWQGPHACLIRDVAGNCYEIADPRGLDPASRLQALRAL